MTYRLLILDAANKVSRTLTFACETEQQALDRAARLRHAHAVELWRDGKMLRRFESHGDR